MLSYVDLDALGLLDIVNRRITMIRLYIYYELVIVFYFHFVGITKLLMMFLFDVFASLPAVSSMLNCLPLAHFGEVGILGILAYPCIILDC